MPESTSAKAGRDRRRSERKVLHLPVTLEGEAPDGQPANGPAELIAVSAHGALIKAQSDFRTGSILKIRNPANDREGEFKVVWTTPVPLEAAWNLGADSASAVSGLWEAAS